MAATRADVGSLESRRLEALSAEFLLVVEVSHDHPLHLAHFLTSLSSSAMSTLIAPVRPPIPPPSLPIPCPSSLPHRSLETCCLFS